MFGLRFLFEGKELGQVTDGGAPDTQRLLFIFQFGLNIKLPQKRGTTNCDLLSQILCLSPQLIKVG